MGCERAGGGERRRRGLAVVVLGPAQYRAGGTHPQRPEKQSAASSQQGPSQQPFSGFGRASRESADSSPHPGSAPHSTSMSPGSPRDLGITDKVCKVDRTAQHGFFWKMHRSKVRPPPLMAPMCSGVSWAVPHPGCRKTTALKNRTSLKSRHF